MKTIARYKLSLFGGFHLTDEHDKPILLTARKSKALLAWLAVNPDHQHPREKLAALLWPDSDEAQARHSLRQALGGLRKVMPDKEGPLQTTKDWIMLESQLISIDALKFDAVLSAANRDNHSLDMAIALYKGQFLEGCNPHTDMFEEWLANYQSNYSERAAAAMSKRLDQLIKQKHYEPVIPLSMQLISIDPFRESAYRSLMQAHFKLGNLSIALRWYRRCQRLLQSDLGVQPETATQALYKELLAGWDKKAMRHDQQSCSTEHCKPNLHKPPAINNASQRILYQTETAIEGILDHIGGQSFLIRGESGTGKAALIEEIINLAKSHTFLICQSTVFADVDKVGVDKEKQLHLGWQLTEKLKVLNPKKNNLKPTDFEALANLLKEVSEISPLLLLVKDIHYANKETLNLLAKLISTAGNANILLLMTTLFEGEPLDPIWRGAMRGAPLTTMDLGTV